MRCPGPPIVYVHSDCGEPITQQTIGAGCGQVQDLAQVTVRTEPGMPPDIAARMSRNSKGMAQTD